MIKKSIFSSLIGILLFVCVFAQTVFVNAQEINVVGKKIEYTLPYSGILPDHPLYGLKSFRDKMWLFLTRDNTKKAELLMLFSDKKIVMAEALAKKGQYDRSATSGLLAEEDFQKALEVILIAKKQGVSPQADVIQKIKLSNEKHQEVLEDILIAAPQGVHNKFEEILKLNTKLHKQLNALE